jgi:hypothetical protein
MTGPRAQACLLKLQFVMRVTNSCIRRLFLCLMPFTRHLSGFKYARLLSDPLSASEGVDGSVKVSISLLPAVVDASHV